MSPEPEAEAGAAVEALEPAALRASLPRAWSAFLARFGTPTEIQLRAAAPILDGRDALLLAPTASGKTEAYLAPLAERCVPSQEGPTQLLIVSPTRALVNDLHRRITPPLAAMGLGCGRWTGDAHDAGRMHPVTVLTPEALDARISRTPQWLDSVRALVIDELHVLDDSTRGDQLRILVPRLRAGRAVQVVSASATVADPAGLAARYLRDATIVQASGRRRVIARIVDGTSPLALARLLSGYLEKGHRKVICFCNSREAVETLARDLRGRPPFNESVFAHHGSLARELRLAAEKRFLSAPCAIGIATSTLELGIDIGSIDLVVLHRPPPDVPALVQRVGRGGRRSDGVRVLCLAEGPFETSQFHTMLAAQKAGEWHVEAATFRPGVLVQQAISVAFERKSRTVNAAALHRRLPPDLALAWPEARIEGVLEALGRRKWLERAPRGGWGVGAPPEKLWGAARLHANIAEKLQTEVTDALTGDVVGSVAVPPAMGVGLGGKGRRVLVAREGRVITEATGIAEIANFGGGSAKSTGPALATALLRGAGIPAPCRAQVAGAHMIFHGLGTAGGLLLAKVFQRSGLDVVHAGRFAVLLEEEPEAWPLPEGLETALGLSYSGIGHDLEMGAWHDLLPHEEQRAAVAAQCPLDAVRALLSTPPPVVATADPELWEEAAWA